MSRKRLSQVKPNLAINEKSKSNPSTAKKKLKGRITSESETSQAFLLGLNKISSFLTPNECEHQKNEELNLSLKEQRNLFSKKLSSSEKGIVKNIIPENINENMKLKGTASGGKHENLVFEGKFNGKRSFKCHDSTNFEKDNKNTRNSIAYIEKVFNKRERKIILRKIKKIDSQEPNKHKQRSTKLTSVIIEERIILLLCKKFLNEKVKIMKNKKKVLFPIVPPKNQLGLIYTLGENSEETLKVSELLNQINDIDINAPVEKEAIDDILISEFLELLYFFGIPKSYIQKGQEYIQMLIILSIFPSWRQK